MILFFSSIIVIIYNAFIFWLANTLSLKKNDEIIENQFISIIVSARNEEVNLPNLIILLMNQTYPKKLYEVIIVNDRSSDKTIHILKDKCSKYSNLSFINIVDTPIDWAPKKWALNAAINKSKGSIILQTDADCIMKKEWIATIVNQFNREDIGFVCAPSPIVSNNLFLNKLFLLDSLSQDAFAASCINRGFPLTCTGRNIAFTRKAFQEINGYENINSIKSGDDDLLLHKIVNNTNYSVSYCLDSYATVLSKAPTTIKEFIYQRLRWASKSPLYYSLESTSSELKLVLPFLYCVNVFCAISLIKFINEPSAGLLFPWLLKSCADLYITRTFFNILNYQLSFIHFFILSIFHPIYISLFGIIGPIHKINWKE